MTTTQTQRTLTHLQRLEAESIHIMREAVAESERPVMLYSVGKDSSVMLHLALKAFYPSPPPFPLLHVDTTWKFREMYEFRDTMAAELGLDLIVHQNPECVRLGINPFDHGSAMHTDMWKTEGLKQALDKHGFDLAFGGARRDEEKSRAKERVFSIRSAQHRWDPKQQRPELWHALQRPHEPGRDGAGVPAVELDRARRLAVHPLEEIPIVPLYFAAPRPVVERDGTLIMVDDDRMPLEPGEVPEMRSVRFRTLGCYPLTGAVESTADTLTGDHPGDAADHHLRAAGPGDRPRLHGVDGEEEAGGLLLMVAHLDPLIADDIEAYLERHEHKSLLRFITCGSRRRRQEHADRPPALRVEAGLRGPARRARGRLEEGRHPGRRTRLRPAGRRPGRRARAGHHHRRRLPVLLDRATQVHRGRHAGPRAVHPQHGHRRLDGRPGRHPDRRPQGRADPDPPAQLPGLAARHPATSCWRSTRWTSSTTPQEVFDADRGRLPGVRGRDRARRHRLHPAVGAARATTSPSPAPTRPGTTARR